MKETLRPLHALHWMLLWRLLAVWAVVGLGAAGVAYLIEVDRFEAGLRALATREMRSLATMDEAERRMAERTRSFLTENHLLIRVYDARGRLLREIRNEHRLPLLQQLEASVAPFPHDGKRHFETLRLGGEQIIRSLFSLPLGEAGEALFFEGAFRLDPLTLTEEKTKLRRLLATILLASLATTLALYPVILLLNRSLLKASRDILRGNLETAAVLGSAIAKRDSDTGEHNYRVTLYAIALAEASGLPKAEMRGLILGAFLHDVGKIGIADTILLKPGHLNDEEFSSMRRHVELGLDIVANSRWLAQARVIIGQHHEKFDGSGYPQGLAGKDIARTARIFAITDVFDALTSARPYKPALAVAEALAIQAQGAGSHFDPVLLETFAGLAAPLHAELHGQPEAALVQRLGNLLPHYFLAPD